MQGIKLTELNDLQDYAGFIRCTLLHFVISRSNTLTKQFYSTLQIDISEAREYFLQNTNSSEHDDK